MANSPRQQEQQQQQQDVKLLTPQRMRRAQLAVGELHQPVQNSGRPFQFLPYHLDS